MEVMIGADMQVLKQIWEFIIKIFKFLWGKDIEYTPDEFYSDTRILKPEQIWLFLRRVLVLVLCYMFVSKTYNFYKFHWYNYKACRGKDICIIQGPDLNYARAVHKQVTLNNGNVLIFGGNSHSKKRPFSSEYNDSEIFDIRRNKFIVLPRVGYECFHVQLIKDYATGKIYNYVGVKSHNQNKQCLINYFDYNTNDYKISDKNSQLNYIDDYYYSKTECIHYDIDYPEWIEYMQARLKLSNFQSLTLLLGAVNNPSDGFDNFTWSRNNTFRILNNKKVFTYMDNVIGTNKQVEIYGPSIKGFIAGPKYNPLKDNIFDVRLKNGDTIFVNKDSTYIFINQKNIFVQAHPKIVKKNVVAIDELNKKSRYLFSKDIDELIVLSLPDNKYLFMCNTSDESNYNHSKRTILYDYNKNLIKDGPIFKYTPVYAGISKISKNEWLVTGGGGISNFYTQIIKVNNKSK